MAAVGRGSWSSGGDPTAAPLARRRGPGVLAAVTVTAVREHGRHTVRSQLAERGATVTVVGTVASDPVPLSPARGDQVLWRLQARRVDAGGRTTHLASARAGVRAAPARVVPLGATVRVRGGWPRRTRGPRRAAFVHGDAEVLSPPGVWWRGGGAACGRPCGTSVAHRPADQRALVPALVVGDDAGLPPTLEADFRATGLTHLLAVSGTNLTLLVGFLLALARWCRVRGRWLAVVGAAGIVGFVLLARTEPSVLRAAVMGTVGSARAGPRRASARAAGARGRRPGAGAGRPGAGGDARGSSSRCWRRRGSWCWRRHARRPGPLAAAVAGGGGRRPLAAQLACTPVVAAISGQVSLVAVVANVLAAPGRRAGDGARPGRRGAGLVWAPLGRLAGHARGWCVAWIIAVAERGAGLPGRAVGVGDRRVSSSLLTVLVVLLSLVAPAAAATPVDRLAAACPGRRRAGAARRPAGGRRTGWVLVACDVGQGDALVLQRGPGAAVVVDAGPDPAAVDRCLDRLGVEAVPLLVLTHFHADHIDGLTGVLDGRAGRRVEVTRLLDPPDGVDGVATPPGSRPVRRRGRDRAATATSPSRPCGRCGHADAAARGTARPPTTPASCCSWRPHGLRILLTGDIEPHGAGGPGRAAAGAARSTC